MSVVVPFRSRVSAMGRDTEVSAADASPARPVRLVAIEQDLMLPAAELKATVDRFIAGLLILGALSYTAFTGVTVYGVSVVFGSTAAWSFVLIFAACFGFFVWRYFAAASADVES